MSKQLDALNRAIEACGSVAEFARRIEKHRPYVYYYRKKAEKLKEGEDLCGLKLAAKICQASGYSIEMKHR